MEQKQEEFGIIQKETAQIAENDRLSVDQWRYIAARIQNPDFSIKKVAEHIGIPAKTVYNWPAYVNETYERTMKDIHTATIEQRRQALIKAMQVKIAGLDSADESIRQKVATEIIEAELGRPANKLIGALAVANTTTIILRTGMDMDEL